MWVCLDEAVWVRWPRGSIVSSDSPFCGFGRFFAYVAARYWFCLTWFLFGSSQVEVPCVHGIHQCFAFLFFGFCVADYVVGYRELRRGLRLCIWHARVCCRSWVLVGVLVFHFISNVSISIFVWWVAVECVLCFIVCGLSSSFIGAVGALVRFHRPGCLR